MPTNTGLNFSLPDSFLIKLSTYDDAERQLLQELGQWKDIEPYIEAGEVRIQKQTFLKYSLFRQKDIFSAHEIAQLMPSREIMLSNLLVERNKFIGINPVCDVTSHRSETEDLGEALGLCTADAMFGTSDLDWRRIGEEKTRTLDTVACTRDFKIEWESKGSIVHNDSIHPSTVRNHKFSIKAKKRACSPSPTSVRLGSIAVLRGESSIPSNIFLVDPPVLTAARDPIQLRAVNRLQNIAGLVSTLKPRSPFAAALQSRLAAIIFLNDFSPLDSLALRDGIGEAYRMTPGIGDIHSTFFSARSVVDQDNVGGLII